MKSKNNINKITIFVSLILSLVILSYLSYYHLSITFYIFFILFESFYFKGVLKIILFIIMGDTFILYRFFLLDRK